MKLDVGCGPTKRFGFVGVDIDPRFKPDMLADVTCLKLDSGSIEFVYSRRCIQHVPDDVAALKEIYRVLKPGCYLHVIVGSWICWLYYKLGLSESSGFYSVFHCYSASRLRKRLLAAGFELVSFKKIRSKRSWIGFDYSVVAKKDGGMM